jgi:hypothetical protein
MSIVRQFTLRAGDRIGWKIDIKNGELVVIVRPVKNSTENLKESQVTK